MKEAKHSPLPWGYWPQCVRVGGMITTGRGAHVAEPTDYSDSRAPELTKANAEFIARACNSYYGMRLALVAASSALGPMENLINPDLRALKAKIEENL